MFDFIARPLGQLLLLFYDFTGSYGLALVLFALAVKVALLPFQMKSKKGMMKQSRLQPKIQEIQKKYASDKTKVGTETQKLYKEEGVNPASGCLWGFLPLPIMFALFQAIRQPLTMMMNVPRELIEEGGAIYEILQELHFTPVMQAFYLELEQAQFISAHFERFTEFVAYGLQRISFELGILNLGQQPLWNFLWHESTDWSSTDLWLPGFLLFLLPLLSGGMQFLSASITRKTQPSMPVQEGAGKSMQSVMMLMPLMSVYFGFILPAALSLYWTVGTILQIFQDLWLNKRYKRILDIEDEERNRQRKIRDAEIEAKRLETERKRAEGLIVDNPNKSKRKKQKSNKQGRLEKTAEWEKKNTPPSEKDSEAYEPSRVGNRRYARGRAYDPDRYEGVEGAVSNESDNELEDVIGIEVDDEIVTVGDETPEINAIEETLEDDDDNDFDDDAEDEDYEDDDDDDEDDGTAEADSDVDEPADGKASDNDEADIAGSNENKDAACETIRFDTARFEEKKD